MTFGERKGTSHSLRFAGGMPPAVEYRPPEDDAWYSVRLRLDGELLLVSYVDFPNESVERFAASSFQDSGELEAFLEKFRLTSEQLQDEQCRKAFEGVTVCAAHRAGEDDVRFYDAVIEAVFPSEHKVVDGEEECLCKFLLFWQHGPNAGSKTLTDIANICLLRHGDAQIHPLLDAFVNISREKINQRMHSRANSGSGCSGGSGGSHRSLPSVVRPDLACKSLSLSSSKFHRSTSCNDSGITLTRKDGNSYGSSQEVEGDNNVGNKVEKIYSKPEIVWHYFIIDNLDPELSPAGIANFIYHHTSILCKVFLGPKLPTEHSARGIVFLEGEENIRKLSSFLEDPDQLVMSSAGRPWLIAVHGSGTFDMICGSLGLNLKWFQETNTEERGHLPENLKVVREGTFEYAVGFRQKKLLIEFHHQLGSLRKDLEERLCSISNLVGCI
ncbi:unnamed protein product [Victoria cruziana]